jgi:hypothetical protein
LAIATTRLTSGRRAARHLSGGREGPGDFLSAGIGYTPLRKLLRGATVAMRQYDPAVEAWLKEQPAPLAAAARRAREIVLTVDPRISEAIKWKVPTFSYRGVMASFTSGKEVLGLMFHQGAKLPGRHPRFEGEGEHVRTMRFADLKAVEAGRSAIAAAVKAWCKWKDAG